MENLNWQIVYVFGHIFIVIDEQILKNNLAIWSHCSHPNPTRLIFKLTLCGSAWLRRWLAIPGAQSSALCKPSSSRWPEEREEFGRQEFGCCWSSGRGWWRPGLRRWGWGRWPSAEEARVWTERSKNCWKKVSKKILYEGFLKEFL